MRFEKTRATIVLRAVNRARKVMEMPALKRMPASERGRSPLDLALTTGAGLVTVRKPPCSHCGAMAAYVGFLKEDSGEAKAVALRKVWPRTKVEDMGGGLWIRLPRLLAHAQYEFEKSIGLFA